MNIMYRSPSELPVVAQRGVEVCLNSCLLPIKVGEGGRGITVQHHVFAALTFRE